MADVPPTAVRNGGLAMTPDGALYVTGISTAITIGTTTITGGATTQVLYNLAGVVQSTSKLVINAAAGAGPSIVAGTTADNTGRALSISQTWTDGTSSNIGIVGNFDMGATGTATGMLLSLQAGAAGTTEVLSVNQSGVLNAASTIIGVGITSTGQWTVNGANSRVASGIFLGFSSAADNSAVADTVISRSAAGVTVFGLTAAGQATGTIGATDFRIGATNPFVRGTAPTLASGGCTSPTAVTSNGTAAFSVGVGTSCSGSQPLVFTLPAATTGWMCVAKNTTNGAASAPAMTGAVSTTSVTITNFSRTLGTAAAWTDADVVVVSCLGY